MKIPSLRRDNLIESVFPVMYALFFLGFFIFPTSKAISYFFYFGIAFPFLAMVLLKKVAIVPIFSGRVFSITTLFLVYLWLTLLWADDFSASDLLVYGRRVLYILCFMASTVYLVNRDKDFLRRLLVLFCWVAAVVSTAYPVYFFARNPFPELRLTGYWLLRNPIGASSIYGVAFISCLYLVYEKRGPKDRLIYASLALPIFLYMLMAQSRGPLAALVAAMLFWQAIIFSRSGIKRGLSGRFTVLLVSVLLVLAATIFFVPEFYQYFILERGLSYRVEIWGLFWERISSAPWFGHGMNADCNTVVSDGTLFNHPHSAYVATLYFGGVAGLAIHLSMIACCVLTSFRIENRFERFLIVCSTLFGALCLATDGQILIQHPKAFWFFFWFPVALCAAYETRER